MAAVRKADPICLPAPSPVHFAINRSDARLRLLWALDCPANGLTLPLDVALYLKEDYFFKEVTQLAIRCVSRLRQKRAKPPDGRVFGSSIKTMGYRLMHLVADNATSSRA